MTEAEIARIEDVLGVRLPAEYRGVMLAYPFAPDSIANDRELPNNADRVIEQNLALRRDGFFDDPWPSTRFALGGDGLGNEFYLDLLQDASPVYVADHESGEYYEEAPSLPAFVADRHRLYAEWAAAAARPPAPRGRWWEFWK